MAAQAPEGFDVARLRSLIRDTYSAVAEDPDQEFHFNRGAEYAVEQLNYPQAELAQIPAATTARFAGVGNPFLAGPIHEGEVVLDHACGAGTDLLLAARKVGTRGHAIGVDMTASMRERSREGALSAGVGGRVDVLDGYLEELPVRSSSVDVVLSNGVINLSPDKERVFSEVVRVLKPGGRLYLADVVIERDLRLDVRAQPDLWAACIGGALPLSELFGLAQAAGLVECEVVQKHDAYADTLVSDRLSGSLWVQGVTFFARKPEK